MSIWIWILYSLLVLLIIVIPIIIYRYCKSLCKISRNSDQRNSSQHVVDIQEEGVILPRIQRQVEPPREKRMVAIDGSNVAFRHSVDKKEFSVKGLSLCIEYFQKRGHDVKAVVPEFRMRRGRSTDPERIKELNSQGIVILTPNKSYDDRFLLDIAIEFDGVVISNDKFRDIINESEAYKNIIEKRVIGYTWCDDVLMLPQDPYGRFGPKLDDILHKPRTRRY